MLSECNSRRLSGHDELVVFMVVIPPKTHKDGRREEKNYLPHFKREKIIKHNQIVHYLLIRHKLIYSKHLQAMITIKFTPCSWSFQTDPSKVCLKDQCTKIFSKPFSLILSHSLDSVIC